MANRVIVVTQGCQPIACYSVSDTATEVELKKTRQALYEARKEELKAAYLVLNPSASPELVTYPKLPDVQTELIDVAELVQVFQKIAPKLREFGLTIPEEIQK